MRRYSILGLGLISKYIIHGIQQGGSGEIVSVCDCNVNQNNNVFPFYSDYNQMIQRTQPDTIILCLPNHLHYAIIEDLIRNYPNLEIIVEKPMVVNLFELRSLNNIISLNGNYPITIYHRLYNKNIEALLYALNGRVDSIAQVDIYYEEDITINMYGAPSNLLPDSNGGGCIIDNGPNCLCILQKIFKSIKVLRIENVKKNMYTEKACIRLDCDGCICSIYLDWNSKVDNKKVVVKLRDGTLLEGNMTKGYSIPKNSLLHEYKCFFKLIDEIEGSENYNFSKENVRIVSEIVNTVWSN